MTRETPIHIPESIALVTGGGGGIGRAIVARLIGKGMRVIVTGRDADRLDAVRDDLGGAVLPFSLDVTDWDAVMALPGSLPVEWRCVDVLVNNAGHDVGGRRAFQGGSISDWRSVIETNVNGLMSVTHALVPGMLERGYGHVVNLGSVSGLFTYAGGTAYNASKFAVHGFTEALRKDFAATDIRVTEILPGMVRTDFAVNRLRGNKDAAGAFYDAVAECLSPDDIAEGVVYALEQPPHVNVSQLVIEPTRTVRTEPS